MFKIKKRYIISFIILIIALVFGISLGIVTWIIKDTPDISNYQGSNETTLIYSADGELLTRLFKENRIYVPLERIPDDLKNAIIAIEDTNFYVHHGIDFWGIPRALITNIKERRIAQGFSTITMQLAENALFKKQERTYYRKIQEIYLAIQFERLYTKPEILEMYLNEIFLGHSAYGVETAAQQYFSKHVWELNLSECALIAGLPKAPNYYTPLRNMEAAINRRNVVLNRMLELGYISEEEAREAKNAEIKVRSAQPENIDELSPYFIRYIRDQLIDLFGAQMVYNGGLRVYTTLDVSMQEKANQAIKDIIADKYIPTVERNNTADKLQPQLALLTLDPQTGAIRAMIGGRGNDQFNRATQAVRQPGSAFKPFVYTTAIKKNYSPATVINDMPIPVESSRGTAKAIWPTNFEDEYRGFVTLRTALANSINVAAVKMIQKVGVAETIETAEAMGIQTFQQADYAKDHLSLALGGLNKGVTILQMATAYGVFANNGIKVEPYAITKVLDKNGNTIYKNHSKKDIVLSPEVSYIMTDLLQSVITGGTGWRANLNRPVAGKTGTTNDYTDAWFVGFTPDLVTAVWIGEDNLQSMIYDQRDKQGNYLYPEGNGPRIVSSSEAARLWGNYMREVVKDREVKHFTVPQNIVRKEIDPVTGLLANEYTPRTVTEIFRKGNVPVEKDYLHGPVETVKIDTETNMLATSGCPEEQVKEFDYIVGSGIRLGPAEIRFAEKNNNKSKDNLVKGTYIVNTGEPVQQIDPELGVPITDKNGEIKFELKPTERCTLHSPKENILDSIWNFFNNSN